MPHIKADDVGKASTCYPIGGFLRVLHQTREQHPSNVGTQVLLSLEAVRKAGPSLPAVPLGLRVAARGREGKDGEKREVGEGRP